MRSRREKNEDVRGSGEGDTERRSCRSGVMGAASWGSWGGA